MGGLASFTNVNTEYNSAHANLRAFVYVVEEYVLRDVFLFNVGNANWML